MIKVFKLTGFTVFYCIENSSHITWGFIRLHDTSLYTGCENLYRVKLSWKGQVNVKNDGKEKIIVKVSLIHRKA